MKKEEQIQMNSLEEVCEWLADITKGDINWSDWYAHYSDSDCQRIAKNALELLKQQEPIPVETKVIGLPTGDQEVWCCRDCRMVLDPNFSYCPHCGAKLSWEGIE